jgi:hypothetical protein
MSLLQLVLDSPSVHFKTLERLVGKLVALALAVPGALIMCRHIYAALAQAFRRGSTTIEWTPLLRDEIVAWLHQPFRKSGAALWKEPWHLTIVLEDPPTVTSLVRGVLSSPATMQEFWVALSAAPWAPGSTPPGSEVGDLMLAVLSQALLIRAQKG